MIYRGAFRGLYFQKTQERKDTSDTRDFRIQAVPSMNIPTSPVSHPIRDPLTNSPSPAVSAITWGFPDSSVVKNLPAVQRHVSDPWDGKIP